MRRFMPGLIALSAVALMAVGALTAPRARFLLPAAAIPTRAAYLPAVFKPEQTPTSTAIPTATATKTRGPTETQPTWTQETTETAEPTQTQETTETAEPLETNTPTRTETPTMTPCSVLDPPSLSASRSGSSVSLSWGSLAGAVSYKVYRSSVGSSGPFSVIASPTGTSASDTIPQATTYWYYVSAVSACGVQSPPSNVVSVTRP